MQVLTGHTGSVLCLQYDERVIISGSSDSTVRYVFYLKLYLAIANNLNKCLILIKNFGILISLYTYIRVV